MTTVLLIVSIVFGLAVLALVSWLAKKRLGGSGLSRDYFQSRWVELLQKVKTTDGMVVAVIDADKLLDEALKRRHFKGRTMGERLVSAQRSLSDNDAVWYAHKLRNRLVHESDSKLREPDAKRALAGIRQALKDVGAL